MDLSPTGLCIFPVHPPQDPKEAPYRCGVRADNLCVVLYEAVNWEKTRFLSKDRGQYEWPTTVNVALPGQAGAPPSPRQYSGSEKARPFWEKNDQVVVAHFEEGVFFKRLVALSLVEKKDAGGLRPHYASLFKARPTKRGRPRSTWYETSRNAAASMTCWPRSCVF